VILLATSWQGSGRCTAHVVVLSAGAVIYDLCDGPHRFVTWLDEHVRGSFRHGRFVTLSPVVSSPPAAGCITSTPASRRWSPPRSVRELTSAVCRSTRFGPPYEEARPRWPGESLLVVSDG